MSYTNGLDDPSAHFQIALYTGNSGTLAVTNDGNSDLQPDLVWTKRRDSTSHNALVDSSRGASKQIYANLTAAEETVSGVTAFNTDGFTLGSNGTANASSGTFAGWQWKANGGTTTSVSASGTGSGCVNACTYQANTTAGFSIITYTGRDDQLNNGQESKLTHGLGVAPDATIMKRTDSTGDWFVMGAFDGANGYPYSNNQFLKLNGTDSINGNYFTGDTAPDATHIFLGNAYVNIASATYVCYAFAEKQGYSKFGKYTGNGNNNGPFIYTGFRPAFIMTKKNGTSGWFMQDIKRGIKNNDTNTPVLQANDTYSEADVGTTDYEIDFLSNGFKLRDNNTYVNASGSTYIYMAFAEHPFVTSTGIPTTAR